MPSDRRVSVRFLFAGRPFRHLCPEADLRDAMTDEEFWAHVLASPEPWPDEVEVTSLDGIPCAECGEVGACGYDFEGRPLVHIVKDEDS